jgi:mono/diheme cytochrome c family protein
LAAELGCVQCHTDLAGPSRIRDQAPDLSFAGLRYRTAYLLEFLQSPRQVRRHVGRARMPSFHLTEAEALALSLHLGTLRSKPAGWPQMPAGLRDGEAPPARRVTKAEFDRELGQGLACLTCHTWEGRGGVLGPELEDVGYQLKPEWIASYLVAPEQYGVMPNVMPPQFYQLSPDRQRHVPIQTNADQRIRTLVGYFSDASRARLPDLESKLARAIQAHPQATANVGERLFEAMNCAACHRHPTATPRLDAAPSLSREGHRVRADWLRRFLQQPTAIRRAGYHAGDGSRMPDFRLRPEEVTALAAYLGAQTNPPPALVTSPTNKPLSAFSRAKTQRLLETQHSCLGCHRLAGKGGVIGPDLSLAHSRLQPDYVRAIISDPARLAPHAIMPKAPLSPAAVDQIARHLLEGDWPHPRPAKYLSPFDSASLFPLPTVRPVTNSVVPDPSLTKSIRSTYLQRCAPCHGPDGRGDGFNAPFLLPTKPTVFTEATTMARRPDDTLFDGIHSGGRILNRSHWMPAWGETLSGSEIKALVRYLRELCRCEGPAWARDGQAPSSLTP